MALGHPAMRKAWAFSDTFHLGLKPTGGIKTLDGATPGRLWWQVEKKQHISQHCPHDCSVPWGADFGNVP